jgi:hypothetical protein
MPSNSSWSQESTVGWKLFFHRSCRFPFTRDYSSQPHCSTVSGLHFYLNLFTSCLPFFPHFGLFPLYATPGRGSRKRFTPTAEPELVLSFHSLLHHPCPIAANSLFQVGQYIIILYSHLSGGLICCPLDNIWITRKMWDHITVNTKDDYKRFTGQWGSI